MTTRVRFHIDTAAALDAWEQTLVGDPRGAPELRRVLLAELKQRLIATDGLPADRLTNDKIDPPRHYVQLDGRTWAGYVVRERRVGLVKRVREVIVMSLGPRPVDPAVRSSAPG